MKNKEYEIITLNESNINNEHICCAIGNDKRNISASNTKKEWLIKQFKEGLVFKKINLRGKAFIEYLPAENAWKPITADGYMLINCLWISGKYKGHGLGKKLLSDCLNSSRDKNGVIVISSDKLKPFLTDKKFFIKYGFEVCDTAFPYFELLVHKFRDVQEPVFNEKAKRGVCDIKDGITFYYSHQCPFTENWVNELSEFVKSLEIRTNIIKFSSKQQAQDGPSVFATFSIFYNGNFLTHEIPTKNRLEKLINQVK